MKLFNSIRARLADIGQIFLLGGPLGLFYVARQARIARRLKTLRVYMDREKDLHRQHMAQLNHEMNEAISDQQGTNIAAAQFRTYCEKQARGQA